jgi:hypothetical protein
VVEDVKHTSLFESADPDIFINYRDARLLTDSGRRFVAGRTFIVLGRSANTRMNDVRAIAGRAFPEGRFADPGMFSSLVRDAAGYRPLLVACATLLAGVSALVLLWNVYSLVSRELVRRRREFAIRQAIGGRPLTITAHHFKWEGLCAAAGSLLGTAVSYWAVSVLRHRQFIPVSLLTPSPATLAVAVVSSAVVIVAALFALHLRDLRRMPISRTLQG